MPQLRVDKIGAAKSGRPKIKSGNDTYYLGSKCPTAPPLGALINADTSNGSFTNDKGERVEMWYLNSWSYAEGTPQTPPSPVVPRSAIPSTNGGFPLNAAPMPSEGYNDGERLTISNWVAAAITSGCVKDCVDIHTWVNASLHALRNAKADLYMPANTAPSRDEFGDPIPF